jgi:hypothetical protein
MVFMFDLYLHVTQSLIYVLKWSQIHIRAKGQFVYA